MTWTKIGDEFPDECERVELSDAAFRAHVEGLCWANRLGLDGQVPARHLRRFTFAADPEAAVAELVAVGFWRRDGEDLVIVHHAVEQIDAGLLQARREADAQRKQRERLRKALRALGVDPGDERDVATLRSLLASRDGHVTRTRDPGRVGSGLEPPPKAAPTDGAADDAVDALSLDEDAWLPV